jgi:hypothetical protein
MDTALGVSVGAAICAGLAAIFAGWSAWESHRSATSSESSARSAAEAVELERKRHHQESTPRLLLEHDGPVGSENDEGGIWLTNNGPLNLENFSVELTQEAKDRPIAGLVDGGQVVTLAARLGPLAVGERRFIPLRRHAPDEGAGTLYLRIACWTVEHVWRVPALVEIPGIPRISVV